MKDNNQLPPMPEPEGVIVVGTQALRGFTADQMRAYALQARAQVQGEPIGEVGTMPGTSGFTMACFRVDEVPVGTPLYTTPQAAQAPQAEVTDGIRPEDFTVHVVVKPMGGFAPANTQGVRVTHKPTGISVTCDEARSQHTNRHQAFETLRTILARRPERVAMTDEQRQSAFLSAPTSSGGHRTAFMLGISASEAHHGIKPKEQA